MRRLLWLAAALAVAWLALTILHEADALTPSRLRDGVLIAALAVGLAAWWSSPFTPSVGALRAWSQGTWILFGSGAATALAGGALIRAGTDLGWVAWAVGLVLLVVAALIPGEVTGYAVPRFRWERDESGRFVRRPVEGEERKTPPLFADSAPRAWWLALALVIALGVGLRVWMVERAPATCQADECATVVALVQGGFDAAGLGALTAALTQLLMWLRDDPTWALRTTLMLLSSLSLVALALALGRVASRVGVLLGVLALALSPWALASLSAANLSQEALFLILIGLWGALSGVQSSRAGGWVMAGLSLGLLVVAAPDLSVAWLVWATVMLILAVTGSPRPMTAGLMLVVSMIAVSLPARLAWVDLASPFTGAQGAGQWVGGLTDPIEEALRFGGVWPAALAIVGMGACIRYRKAGIVILAGLAATLFVLLNRDLASFGLGGAIVLLLAWPALFVGMALDQYVRLTISAWGALVRPATVTATAFVLIAAMGIGTLVHFARTPVRADAVAGDAEAQAAVDYLNSLRSSGTLPSTLLVPPDILNHAALRLNAADEIAAGSVRAWDLRRDLPWRGDGPRGVTWLLPQNDVTSAELLQRAYPNGSSTLLPDGAAQPLLLAYSVDGAALFDSQGLQQLTYLGANSGAQADAGLSLGVGPLAFDWIAWPPSQSGWSAEWTGSLLVDAPGVYSFTVDAPAGSLFSLQLDDRLVLDTSAGLTSRAESLVTGPYRLEMRYTSGGVPGNLIVSWQPPGGELAAIPREALHNPPLPTVGLLATWTAGSSGDETLIAERKDASIRVDPTLEEPYAVLWKGQLAAPRAGEYLIGASTNGDLLLTIDDKPVIERLTTDANEADAEAPPSEGIVYLERGWHPVTIRFATDDSPPSLSLYWQPPGAMPEPLDAMDFVPYSELLAPDDLTMPLPVLADERLGDETFALTLDPSIWQPVRRFPPADLPLLALEKIRTFGSCGSAPNQLSSPRGISFDPTGSVVYVADTGNRRVVAWPIGEGEPTLLPLDGLEEPVDVAVSAEGEISVLDTIAPKIVRWAPNSVQPSTTPLPAGFYRPRGLDTDARGLVFLADTGGARVAVTDHSGGVVAEYGGPDSELGRGQPVDVVSTGVTMWAVTAEDGRLWKLDSLASITVMERTDTISGPHLAQIDGSLFVSDPAGGRVIYLDERGKPVASLAEPGAFTLPTGVAAVRQGDDVLVAVSDAAACTVSVWQGSLAGLQP